MLPLQLTEGIVMDVCFVAHALRVRRQLPVYAGVLPLSLPQIYSAAQAGSNRGSMGKGDKGNNCAEMPEKITSYDIYNTDAIIIAFSLPVAP